MAKNQPNKDLKPKTELDERFLSVAREMMLRRGIKSDRAISVALGKHPDFINRVQNGYQSATPDAWDILFTQFPEATVITQNQNAGNAIGTNHGTSTQSIGAGGTDIERERDALKQEVEFLKAQLIMKDSVIAAKDETIDLLKAAFNRPN